MVIGISGKKNSGKDLSGEIIRTIDPSYRVIKYADKLKDIICVLIGCTREQLEDREFKETPLGEEWWIYKDVYEDGSELIRSYNDYPVVCNKGNMIMSSDLIKVSPRWLLQYVGTECFRRIINPNTWVNATFSGIKDDDDVVITDVRFPNEAEAIRKHGGIVIRVARPETDSVSDNHISETALDDYEFDYVINNDGTIDELKNKIKDIFNDGGTSK